MVGEVAGPPLAAAKNRILIPRILHYCWVGPRGLPEKLKAYQESWTRHLPEWRIRAWGNGDIDSTHPFLRRVAAQGHWGQVSDYLRWQAVYEEGGIYFDTDVEVVRPLGDTSRWPSFLGFENVQNRVRKNPVGTAIFGFEKGHSLPREMLRFYERHPDRTILNTDVLTRLMLAKGLRHYHLPREDFECVTIDGVRIYHSDIFYPNLSRHPEWAASPPPQTLTFHHVEGSWGGTRLDPLPLARRIFDARWDRKILRPVEKALKKAFRK